MTKYQVWSLHEPERDSDESDLGHEALEATRHDAKTAEADAALLHSVSGRRTWVVEV